eukprot:Gb_31115 [translate_table: standard]
MQSFKFLALQKDKQSSSSNADASSYYQYPESDAIRLANRAEEADVSSSWTPGEDDELDSTLSHAEVKFPIRSNAIESSPDISYAVITISEAIPSSASLSLFDEEISIGPYILPTYKDAEEQFLDEYEDYFEHLSVDNIRKEQYPKLELQRLVYFDYANFALFSRFQLALSHFHLSHYNIHSRKGHLSSLEDEVALSQLGSASGLYLLTAGPVNCYQQRRPICKQEHPFSAGRVNLLMGAQYPGQARMYNAFTI